MEKDFTFIINCPKCNDSTFIIESDTDLVICPECFTTYNIKFHFVDFSVPKVNQYTFTLYEE